MNPLTSPPSNDPQIKAIRKQCARFGFAHAEVEGDYDVVTIKWYRFRAEQMSDALVLLLAKHICEHFEEPG